MMETTDSNRPRKPNRPLSAYNLFYRYKRMKMIDANGGGNQSISGTNSKDDMYRLVATTPGIEHCPPSVQSLPQDRLNELRRTNIRMTLQQQLFAKDKGSRSHHKSAHGFKMSFVEMNTIMLDCWRATDEFTKGLFREMAVEGRKRYQQLLIEYTKKRHLSVAIERIYSRAEDIPKFNKKLKLDIPPSQDISSISISSTPKTKHPAGPSSFGSPDVDLTWEPLPFLFVASPPNHTFHSAACTSYASPVPQKTCIPATITPDRRVQPGMGRNSFLSNSSLFSNANVLPEPPLSLEVKKSDKSEESKPSSSIQHIRPNVSAEDFMQLFTTLADT